MVIQTGQALVGCRGGSENACVCLLIIATCPVSYKRTLVLRQALIAAQAKHDSLIVSPDRPLIPAQKRSLTLTHPVPSPRLSLMWKPSYHLLSPELWQVSPHFHHFTSLFSMQQPEAS